MALSLEIIEKEDYLLCTMSGEHDSVQEYMEPISAVLKYCRNSHYSRAIIDYRSVALYPTTAERIALLEEFAKLNSIYANLGGGDVRLAFITGAESADRSEIPKTVARHLGLNFIRTFDFDEALAWLRQDVAPKQ